MQADQVASENAQLKAYITKLEESHLMMSTDLANWQTRWKTTATNNVMLCQQLLQVGGPVAAPHARPPRVPEGNPRTPANQHAPWDLPAQVGS